MPETILGGSIKNVFFPIYEKHFRGRDGGYFPGNV